MFSKSTISLRFLCLGLSLLILSANLSAQRFDFPVQNSDKIVEGKVVQSTGTWNKKKSFIYMLHKVSVSKVFKGSAKDKEVYILTNGGEAGGKFLYASHSNPVNENARGLFFLRAIENNLPDSLGNLEIYRIVNYEQGYAPYYDDGINPPAIYNGKKVRNRKFDLTLPLQEKTGKLLEVQKQNTEHPVQESSGLPVIIYSIENVATTGPYNDTVEFDVYARIEQQPGSAVEDETAFANAELYFDYDTTLLGSNVAQSGNVEVSKGEIIQNSNYSISLLDSTLSKAKVDIEYSGGADDVTWVGSDPMELFKVKAQIVNPVIHSTILFDEPSMEEQSQYYDTVSNTFETYYDVQTEGEADVNMYPQGDVGINFGIDNQRLIGGNPPDSIRFDITAYASQSGTKLENSDIYLKYNPNAFGYKIKASNSFSFKLGPAFDTANYDDHSPQFYDINDSTLNILIYKYQQGTGDSGYVPIPTHPINLITLTFAVKECGYKNNLSFVETEMIDNQTYVGGDTNKFRYRRVVATDIDSNVTCSDSLPIITSFKPKHGYGPIAAGIKDTLIINGLNFTDTGSVWFRNADTLVKYGRVYENDIKKWNDTLIELVLPGTLYPDDGPPGTGEFYLKNGNGDTATSPEEIDIPFAGTTIRTSSGADRRFILSDINNHGGYSIVVDSAMLSYNLSIECVHQALKQWHCPTVLNSFIADTISLDTITQFDDTSSISFGGSNYFPSSNNLAVTYFYGNDRFSGCSGNNNEIIWQAEEMDIVINDAKTWFIDTNSSGIQSGEYDFYSTVLHELGHFHQLNHSLPSSKQMY